MTIPTVTVASLKKYKNTVIGNPVAKVQLVRDELFVTTLIDCLNPAETVTLSSKASQDALRIEAAHVIASLSYGSEEALGTLLRANTHHAILYAISHFTRADPPVLRAAFSRALRALASSIADIVGPSLWGLKEDNSIVRDEAHQALEHFFQVETLDIYLPLLLLPTPSTPSTPITSTLFTVATSTAQMLSSIVRTTVYRRAVTDWLPQVERQPEVKSRRGWEKTSALSSNTTTPWVARQLVALLGDNERERDSKLVDAVLSALAALAKENPTLANVLAKPTSERDQPPALINILGFTKSRSVDVQLAACLCVTNIVRASSSPSPSRLSTHPTSPSSSTQSSTSTPHSFARGSSIHHHRQPPLEESCTRTVMNVVNRILALQSPSSTADTATIPGETPQTKTKACFILHYLVNDDAALCLAAFDRGCLEFLATLIQSISPPEPTPPEWEEDEPESISCLREAALTALASLSLFSDDIRRRITDDLRLLPCISRALRVKKHVGTRYAACQCVRALSRAVSVLRTNIVDSGLGMDILKIVLGRELGERNGGGGGGGGGGVNGTGTTNTKGKEGADLVGEKKDENAMEVVEDGDEEMKNLEMVKGLGEDRRVIGAALAAVCNILTDFSPLRPIYLEEKLMPRLIYIMKESGDPSLRLSALWAVKNVLRKTSTETKRDVMSHLGWPHLVELLGDPDEHVQEQAFNVVRNLTESEDGIAMVFREIGIQVLGRITTGLSSGNDNVVLQAASALANMSNGTHEQQDLILSYPNLLSALQICLSEAKAEVRGPAVSCILELVTGNPRRKKTMMEAGIVGTLRRLCEWSGHGHSPSHGGGGGWSANPSAGGGGTGGGGRSPGRHSGSGGVGSGGTGTSTGGTGGPGSWGGSGSMRHIHGSSHSTTGMDEDRFVIQRARVALDWLEHGEGYV